MTPKVTKALRTLLGGLSLALILVPMAETAKPPAAKDVPLKATLVGGYLPGADIPNKILDDGKGDYLNNSSNIIKLFGSSGSLVFSVYAKSGRSVLPLFDEVVAPPGTNLKDSCGVPYFLPGPVSTINWKMGTKNECVMSETPDAEGYYELTIKDNYLNLLTMQDGQVAYAYLQPMTFSVADSKTTTRNDSRDLYILDWEPNYVMVRAYDWDGTKVNSWSITPVTTKFKHMKGETAGDPVPEYYLYPDGTLPRWLISNATRSCFHGIYMLPYELIVRRLQ